MKKISKILIAVLLISFVLTIKQSLAAMDSGGFQIWLDDISAGGGAQESDSYKIETNISSHSGSISQSANFTERVSFSGIEDEPTVGFSVQSVNLDFGELSPNFTAYSSHVFSAFTNAKEGYTIRVYGLPLNSVNYTMTEIGATAQPAEIGSEQFGLNLVANSNPLIGQNPLGGIGQAAANYDTSNYFAYTDGAIIAQAASFSYQTDFTVTVIVNIAEDTPAGIYSTTLTYEFIPVF